jgi:hypothetical protein
VVGVGPPGADRDQTSRPHAAVGSQWAARSGRTGISRAQRKASWLP